MSELSMEYGAGLFSAAVGAGAEAEILEESRVLSGVFTGEYVRLLSNPEIPKSERLSLVSELLDGKAHPYLVNFVKLMTERSLAHEITDSFLEYKRLYYEYHGIIRVRAESAIELTERQKQKLHDKLASHTGYSVEIEYAVCPELLGGMKLFYDNRRIDGTVKSKLGEIGVRLADTVI